MRHQKKNPNTITFKQFGRILMLAAIDGMKSVSDLDVYLKCTRTQLQCDLKCVKSQTTVDLKGFQLNLFHAISKKEFIYLIFVFFLFFCPVNYLFNIIVNNSKRVKWLFFHVYISI